MSKKLNTLDSRVAKREGKKKQVSIGNVREVRASIVNELADDQSLLIAFIQAIAKVQKKKKK